MIHVQRPDATACAEYRLWSEKMNRHVRYGAKSIAIISQVNGVPTLRYVFDVSDTRPRANARTPYLWQYREEHQAAVSKALAESFSVPADKGVSLQLATVAAQFTGKYWELYRKKILQAVKDTLLQKYGEADAGMAFQDATAASVSYALLYRCGLSPEQFFDAEDFSHAAARKYLAERAILLGAVRLPNNAFRSNAGTDVVSDIIFLQKSGVPILDEPEWTGTAPNELGFNVNQYFLHHPEMVLGIPTEESTRYGRQDYTVAPIPGADFAQQLQEAIRNVHGEYEAALPDEGEENDAGSVISAEPGVRNYSFAVVGGQLYFRENSVMTRQKLNATATRRVKGMVELRDCVYGLIALQLNENVPDSAIKAKQAELDRLYDAYTRKFGLINGRANRLAFERDSAYYLLCSLEILDDDWELM